MATEMHVRGFKSKLEVRFSCIPSLSECEYGFAHFCANWFRAVMIPMVFLTSKIWFRLFPGDFQRRGQRFIGNELVQHQLHGLLHFVRIVHVQHPKLQVIIFCRCCFLLLDHGQFL